MPAKDHHSAPFDPETLVKLKIFEDYAQAWIPTFVMQKCGNICIFDFFAGPGKDKNGIDGSPIRILKKIKEQIGNILEKGIKIQVFLNELDKNKFELLKLSCSNYLEENIDVKEVVTVHYHNRDCDELFNDLYPSIESNPSLVYFDQNGIKHLKHISALERTSGTDFLYFVSSSFVRRFGDQDEFKAYLNVDMQELKNQPYEFIHRTLLSAIRDTLLPTETKMRLYPFSIKKGSNIYGIIFGASHIRAVDKFLAIAWSKNQTNGEANFDIDDDNGPKQLNFLSESKPTKIESFQKLVKQKILSKEITNNIDLFTFVLEEGHIGKHAADSLRSMKKNGEITYESTSPLITYENYRDKKRLEYKVNRSAD
jgi:three-Cys-motif partner protein